MSPSTKMACTQRSTQVRYFQADSSLCVSIEVACFWPSKTKYLLKKGHVSLIREATFTT